MAPRFTAGAAEGDAELFIHLDLNGLAALLGAVQTAMDSGRGQLECGASGVTARSDSPGAFATVTVTFSRPSDDREDVPARADPTPTRRSRTPEPAA